MSDRLDCQYPLVAEVILNGGDNVSAVGTYDLGVIPAGAVIVGGWYAVVDTFTGTGTIAIKIDDGTTQTSLNAADAGDAAAIGALDTGLQTTLAVPHTLQAVVATAALTDGKAKVYVQYLIEGRAHEAG